MAREQKAKRVLSTPVRSFPKVYAGRYTRCDHCGVYDRNPQWCALCGRSKTRAHAAVPALAH